MPPINVLSHLPAQTACLPPNNLTVRGREFGGTVSTSHTKMRPARTLQQYSDGNRNCRRGNLGYLDIYTLVRMADGNRNCRRGNLGYLHIYTLVRMAPEKGNLSFLSFRRRRYHVPVNSVA